MKGKDDTLPQTNIRNPYHVNGYSETASAPLLLLQKG